ncbi:MAG TPA: hypothetical protein VM120_07795 [Bryobacteraceae bacterium]|nr:hypothetical protein [Bryobacteraceae bacterium]
MWERVLPTDWSRPSTAVLSRIADSRSTQFWDSGRLLSQRLGEKKGERGSIVWDWIAIYPPGVTWGANPPQPAYQGRPVEDVAEEFRRSLAALLR